ncbi:MAG: tRNA ((37)-N6)-threonylcarbamoyltransferase complex ATPase subunit type 1 TsaE [Alphaproteobacteria bacterium]|jgi:tRNA threonylcarbamoyladenosine biosynthesis protein TsaE|nr:tRNA ((37)-N6)-threonylcarbamoyltransferase complex ATPase subunit type 1 TsaE [Alphaproteobacteria bacterium]
MIHLPNEQATEALGRSIAPLLRPGDSIALFGELGAGKTSLSRGILLGLGHDGEVASPTFPIVQTYDPPDVSVPVWHVDLYRIEAAHELEELGLDDALTDSALLIEWPERLPSLWPDTLRLGLDVDPRGGRNLTASVPTAWERRWPPR